MGRRFRSKKVKAAQHKFMRVVDACIVEAAKAKTGRRVHAQRACVKRKMRK